ncbi:MAG: hypothetical protein J7480_10340, partial [Microbacteriaceae bacterium]|nr:hypothetical protein [Microbacteriaceae bacterium]
SLYTGHQLTDLDFVELVDFEAISEGHGLPTTEAERLLEDAGIPAEIRTDVSVEELDQLLQDGYGVTIAIDSGEVWGQDTVDGDQESDHMVMVTEIDLEHGIVRLNDSGSPDGRSETMSLELFLDAWADSNNQAVICDVSLDEYWAEHGVPEAAEDIVVDDALGAAVRSPWALLPITVQQSDLS